MRNRVFVFGSNTSGRHGKGAALTARQCYGAIQGIGEGPMGQSYALPTCDGRFYPLSLEQIRAAVDRFMVCARSHPELDFQVTRVGCGLAYYKDHQIAPMFIGAPENCLFDTKWKAWLDLPETRFWGTF